MTSNSIGKIFSFTTWGESHGKAVGCVIDGVPSNIKLTEKDIQPYLDKRKPGQSKFTTQRKEKDFIIKIKDLEIIKILKKNLDLGMLIIHIGQSMESETIEVEVDQALERLLCE